MEVSEEQVLIHHFINDFWKFIKTRLHADADDDAYWDRFIQDMNLLGNKYKDPITNEIHPLIRKLLVAHADYLGYEGCGRERPNRRRA